MAGIIEQLDVSDPVVHGYARLPGSSSARRRALTPALIDYCDRHELALAAVFTDAVDGPHGAVLTAAFTSMLEALDVDGVCGVVLPSPDQPGDRTTALRRYGRIMASGRRLMFALGAFTATRGGAAGSLQTSPPLLMISNAPRSELRLARFGHTTQPVDCSTCRRAFAFGPPIVCATRRPGCIFRQEHGGECEPFEQPYRAVGLEVSGTCHSPERASHWSLMPKDAVPMHAISKTFKFEAAHHLNGLPEGHKCGRNHGHSYIVTVELAAEKLDATGFVTDFANLDPVGDYIKTVLDHRDLNELRADNSRLLFPQPSSELIAVHVYEIALHLLPSDVSSMITAVRVSETASSHAVYLPPGRTM